MNGVRKVLCLFDIDGTLTKPRQVIDPDMMDFLLGRLKAHCTVALVGGSDLKKIVEQMGGLEAIKNFEYTFAENGLVALKNGEEIGRQTIQKHIGEEKLQKFINFALRHMSGIELPVKRGTFIEFRSGLINVSPVGRSCSQEEREQFALFDQENKIREKFIQEIKKEFPDLGLTYSIGGQISFDVFPNGWDKTYCLRYLDDFETIHFFGDKTEPGENDFEIFIHPRTIGHKVTGPDDTKHLLTELFKMDP